MPNSGVQSLQADAEALSGGAIPFQFELSWRSLTQPATTPVTELASANLEAILPSAIGQPLPFVPSGNSTELPLGPCFATAIDGGSLRNWVLPAVALLLLPLAVLGLRSLDRSSPDQTSSAVIEMG